MNVYIVYNLDKWPNNSKPIFGATDIVENGNKGKYIQLSFADDKIFDRVLVIILLEIV